MRLKVATFIVLTAFAVQMSAQTNQQKNAPPAGTSTQAPASQQTPANQTAPPAGAQTTPGAPAPGRKLPMAKSQAELTAYQATIQAPDLEAATNDFATKFPDSELRYLLYAQLMQRFQQQNNGDKAVETADKALAVVPDDTLALVMKSAVLAETTRSTDIDKLEKYDAVMKSAKHAIETIDIGMLIPPGISQDQIDQQKGIYLSMAHAAMGMVLMQQQSDAAAEKEFKSAIDAAKSQPDALNYLRLSITQDHQRKYQDALASAKQAAQYAQPGSPVVGMAKQEQDRLTKLIASPPPAPAAPSPTTEPVGVPKL